MVGARTNLDVHTCNPLDQVCEASGSHTHPVTGGPCYGRFRVWHQRVVFGTSAPMLEMSHWTSGKHRLSNCSGARAWRNALSGRKPLPSTRQLSLRQKPNTIRARWFFSVLAKLAHFPSCHVGSDEEPSQETAEPAATVSPAAAAEQWCVHLASTSD